jgi:hypothetical protein
MDVLAHIRAALERALGPGFNLDVVVPPGTDERLSQLPEDEQRAIAAKIIESAVPALRQQHAEENAEKNAELPNNLQWLVEAIAMAFAAQRQELQMKRLLRVNYTTLLRMREILRSPGTSSEKLAAIDEQLAGFPEDLVTEWLDRQKQSDQNDNCG